MCRWKVKLCGPRTRAVPDRIRRSRTLQSAIQIHTLLQSIYSPIRDAPTQTGETVMDISELSLGWVDPRVGLGWVGFRVGQEFLFLVG